MQCNAGKSIDFELAIEPDFMQFFYKKNFEANFFLLFESFFLNFFFAVISEKHTNTETVERSKIVFSAQC